MINVEWSVIKDFAQEKRVNEQDLFNAVRRAVTAPQALEKQASELARAQGGQGAEVVAWCWEYRGLHVSTDKAFVEKLAADGFTIRPLVFGGTQPQPAVPEAKIIIDRVVEELENGFVACERCGDQEDTATLDCMTDLKRLKALLSAPTTPQADGWMLSETNIGMRISAEGVLGRVRGQLKFGAQEMLKHLEAMSEAFYSGNVKAVDQFLQTWDLDEKRPQPPAGQEGA